MKETKPHSEYPIFFNRNGAVQLNNFLNNTSYSKLIVLVDQNTKVFCLPTLKTYLTHSFYFIEIRNGERHKNIKTCQFIWENLTELGADRKSILINLGGGVVTDIGGFSAATYKRGIRFINIPTSVLGMVDAAMGGKTGIDFYNLKNQIGVFQNPIALLVDINYLDTLPKRELFSGMAEILKYGFIYEPELLTSINKPSNDFQLASNTIKQAVQIKLEVVQQDPNEQGIRKILNFGHTLGHAIESHFMGKLKKEQLLHGEAIAIGMVMALHLSYQTLGLPLKDVEDFSTIILRFYTKEVRSSITSLKRFKSQLPQISNEDINPILDLLRHDKKNLNGETNFILLKKIGVPVIDCKVNEFQILEAIEYYNVLNIMPIR